MAQGSSTRANGVHKIETTIFSRFFHDYLEIYESISRVNIIESLHQSYQIKAFSLGHKKNDFV